MLTTQSYVGKGDFSPSPTPTAPIAAKILSSADHRPHLGFVNPATGQMELSWKPFPGLEHLYEISFQGEVRHIVTGKPVRTYMNKGFEILMSRVKVNGKFVRPSIHRAVALAFIPNPDNHLWVRPKDKDKPLTHASNLEWVPKRFLGVRHVRVPSLAWSGMRPLQPGSAAQAPTSRSYGEYILKRLFDEGRLTEAQYKRAGIVRAQDDSMAPQIPEGAEFVAAPISPSDYQSLVGKVVAVVVKAQRFAYYLGRVVSITDDEVRVSRDNSEWSDRIESRSVIASIARVVSVLETSVY